jgi:acyl-coenzyme A thioesterase PaaI-like protein
MAHDAAEGPWTPGFCHGGAPAALIVHAAGEVRAPGEMGIARVTVDLMRPVPIGELIVDTRIAREGKKVQLVDVEIRAADALVARGAVLKMRREEQRDAPAIPAADFAGPEQGVRTRPPIGVGFSQLFDMRSVAGSFETLGPAAVWFRMSGTLVADESMSVAALATASADFANGVASALPFDTWSYPSTDLTVSFAREPIGPWILVDAECWGGFEGRGVAHARLGDALGWFGRSTQTIIFERRR